jgi:acyl-CoA dehydrogenase
VLDGDEWVINGEKHYISGAGDPRCKIMITMVRTSPDAPAAQAAVADPGAHGHPGGGDRRPACTCSAIRRRAARPHAHRFDNVRVPASNMLLGEGRGFEISQLRLGPGRIHHCMRSSARPRRRWT